MMIKLKDLIGEAKEKALYKVNLDGPMTNIERSKYGESWALAKREAVEYLKDHYEDYRDALRDMRSLKQATVDAND